VSLLHLHLHDFRSFAEAHFSPDPTGTTVLTGPNGTGKTTLLEATAYLGTGRSFRGAARDVMIRTGSERAVIRAELDDAGRAVLIEAELVAGGRARAQVNRQPVSTRRQLAEAVPVTVFSPDDLAIVQGGPARRRDLVDDALRLLDPRSGARLDQVDRVLRQRGALLRQAGGRRSPEIDSTLDIWDERLTTVADEVVADRRALVTQLEPVAAEAYAALAAAGAQERRADRLSLAYVASWAGPLGPALVAARRDDIRRAVTTVGPHRDDLGLQLGGRDAREQASQGEQRGVALALRLAVHHLVTAARTSPPVLLLDDVFSELDPGRARALVHQLPPGQALLTTAVPLPADVAVAAVVEVGSLTGPAGPARGVA
jgi:DNA replication and repair protein RecF